MQLWHIHQLLSDCLTVTRDITRSDLSGSAHTKTILLTPSKASIKYMVARHLCHNILCLLGDVRHILEQILFNSVQCNSDGLFIVSTTPQWPKLNNVHLSQQSTSQHWLMRAKPMVTYHATLCKIKYKKWVWTDWTPWYSKTATMRDIWYPRLPSLITEVEWRLDICASELCYYWFI